MALSLGELQKFLADSSQLPVVSPTGQFGFVPRAEKEDAFRRNYRPATPEEIQNELDYKEYGEGSLNEAIAGTLGYARGSTFGMSDTALVGLSRLVYGKEAKIQAIRKLEEQNPYATIGGEISGISITLIIIFCTLFPRFKNIFKTTIVWAIIFFSISAICGSCVACIFSIPSGPANPNAFIILLLFIMIHNRNRQTT
jgi:hypothetical protein